MLFAVDENGVPLGIAATPTAETAVDLVRALCRAQEIAMADGKGERRRSYALSARPTTKMEERTFQKSAMSGGVRLAGILIAAQPAESRVPESSGI